MSAADLLSVATQVLFLFVCAVTVAKAVRHPRRANFDIALLFSLSATIIIESWLDHVAGIRPGRLEAAFAGSVLMALSFLMLRLVDDFTEVPLWLMRAAALGFAVAIAGLFAVPAKLPIVAVLAYVLYFFVLEVYCAAKFVQTAVLSRGVTRRRMEAVAAGSVFLGLVLVVAGVQQAVHPHAPRLDDLWTSLSGLLGFACGLSYYLGFATPAVLRRAWQEPDLRAFLGNATDLPRLPSLDSMLEELQRGIAHALGAPHAVIIIADEAHGTLRARFGDEVFDRAADELIAGRVFRTQQPEFLQDAPAVEPENAEVYRRYGVMAVIAVPVTTGARRLGVLTVWSPRAPIFAEEDLSLAQLLADQVAVVLENRRLIDEAASVRAREETTRLKDEFLASAAHDLKTPLTALIGQAQLLERRAIRRPDQPPDIAGLRRLSSESQRLRDLVLSLLDVSRAENGGLLSVQDSVDLSALARESCTRHSQQLLHCEVDAPEPVVGCFDVHRIRQLFENLVENAVKYSPQGGEVLVTVRARGDEAEISVNDHGIGIAPADLPHVFERFHRGANADASHFAGMGLGLYICKGIVEQHGGRIEVSSEAGTGTTFLVALPLRSAVSTEGDQRESTLSEASAPAAQPVAPSAATTNSAPAATAPPSTR